jgi:hypothetical protein
MPRSLSNKYPLVPSAQFKTSRLAPLTLIPAVPVMLGGAAGRQLYAAIDTGARISVISEDSFHELDRAKLVITRHPAAGPAGSTVVEVAGIPLFLCDPAFAPWIDLGEVPFVVARGQALSEPTSRILLGFESCLAKLRIDIDYPGNFLTVHAPVRAGRRGTTEALAVNYPSRIREGERLIAMGSYEAAVAVIAAAVEEAVVSSAEWAGRPAKNWNLFVAEPNQTLGFEPGTKAQLRSLWDLRNKAVHGSSRSAISKSDAEVVLRVAKEIITEASNAKSRT